MEGPQVRRAHGAAAADWHPAWRIFLTGANLRCHLSTRRIVGALRVKEGKMDQALDFLLTNGEWEPSAQDLLSAMAHNAAAARAPGAAGVCVVYWN